MKRICTTFLVICCLFLLPNMTKAQNTLSVPNGDFTNWSTSGGYSFTITIMGMPISIPVYNDITYPSEWSFPVFPLNFNTTYQGQNVNINTNLPLVKVSQENVTSAGNGYAVKIESFQLSDIFTSVAYALIGNSLEGLDSVTIPTILTNAEIQVDHFFELLALLSENTDSTSDFLSNLSDVDLNEYLQGGMPLNGFVPGKLVGQYKYSSGENGDNGAILVLGTRYDTELQRRVVVGGGFNINLTDAADYTPFEVIYHSSNEFDSELDYLEADSLCIFLLSSASENIQQYSALYVDNLVLTEYDSTEVMCATPYFIVVTDADTSSATLNWVSIESPNYWETEYGLQGFTLGSGTNTTISGEEITLTNLQPDTYYDLYVRGVCDDGVYGNWAMKTFKTNAPGAPSNIQDILNSSLSVYPNPASGNCTLKFDNQLPTSVKLYSIDGKLLQTLVPTNNSLTLDLPYSGVFMLSCECENGVITKKIVNF